MKRLTLTTIAILYSYVLLAQSPAVLQSQAVYWINNGQFELIDSLLHYHSNGHFSYGVPGDNAIYPDNGIYHDDSTVKLDSKKEFKTPSHRYVRTFNSSGQVAKLLTEMYAAPKYFESQTTTYSYNAAGLPEYIIVSQSGIDNQRTTFSYNNDQLVARLYETWNKSTKLWEKWTVDSTICNSSDSIQVQYIAGIGTPLKEFTRHRMLLDVNHCVLVDSCFMDKKFQSVTFSKYDGAGRKSCDSIQQWDGVLLQTLPYSIVYDKYDNNGNLVSKRTHIWDAATSSYIFNTVDSLTYYANNHLATRQHYSNAGNTLVPAEKSVFEYFYYGFPTGVAEVPQKELLVLFPIPAVSYIHMELNFNQPETFSVTIMNMQGQVLRTWSDHASFYQKQVQLNGLPAGNYFLQVQTIGGYMSKPFIVIN